MKIKNIEIAPGICFIQNNGHYSLILEDSKIGPIICWDFEEIVKDPNAWYSSLKAVALATQYGPSIAEEWIKSRRAQMDTSAGMMFCNICNTKFIADENHPYIFIANINNHKYYDLQCSLECNKKRQKDVYQQELGTAFLKDWNNKFNINT